MSAFEKLAAGFTGGLKRAFQLPARLVQGVREMAEAVKNPYCETMMEESFNADGSNAPLAMLQPTETTPQAPEENVADRLVRFAAPSLTADN